MKLMNLEGYTGTVSLDELFELRGVFEKTLSSTEWLDSSIEGNGFNIVFPNKGKFYFLRCEYHGEDD